MVWQPDFIHRHPYVPLVALLIFGQVVNALPAPTAKSGNFYVFFFKLMTGLNNLARAISTKVEGSPNWDAAVAQHAEKQQAQQNEANKP